MAKEKNIFIEFLRKKGLKLTKQREEILVSFLKVEKHLSTEDLYKIVKKKNSSVGQATVFRTLKLLTEAGIAREIDLADKITRFEHAYNHQHHDHIICSECSRLIEAYDSKIEELQNDLCEKFGFSPTNHKLQIFGICKQCKSKYRNKQA